tara:strand:- start:5821 stop:6981 length:1161 start_codon:yes stop_codon:yes gene_type:complete
MSKTKAVAAVDISAMWADDKKLKTIREMYCPTLNDEEFKVYATIGKMTNLNPALREIWAIKYGNKPATIFVGRDGYRKSAQAHKEYDFHTAVAVHKNDTFSMDPQKSEVNHTFNLTDRGDVVGAYCIVKRKSSSQPAFNYVDLKEYVQPHGVWKDKPATMIKKVAEAQGLRGSFQELFAGTYEESENWEEPAKKKDPSGGDVIETSVVGHSEQYSDVADLIKNAPSLKELKVAKDYIMEYGNSGEISVAEAKDLSDKMITKHYELTKAAASGQGDGEIVDVAEQASGMFTQDKQEGGDMDLAVKKAKMLKGLGKRKSTELRDYINSKGWDCPGSKEERMNVILANEFEASPAPSEPYKGGVARAQEEKSVEENGQSTISELLSAAS